MSDIKCIVDTIGRTVVGKLTEETDLTITLNNPVIIHVQPDQQTGQLQVQSFPYLFMEFIKGDKKQNNWTFHKQAIVISDVELDDRIVQQYENINSPQQATANQMAPEEPEVIKLFDE